MRFKLTILLLALNAALAGIIFYLDRVQSTRGLIDDASRLVLNPDFVRGIDQITIHPAESAEPWVLQHSPEAWRVTSPISWKANPYAVDQLLFQLQQLAWQSRFPVSDLQDSGQSLALYNLDEPPLRVNLQAGDQSLVLNLGAPTEIGNRLYLMSPDGEFIYVVSRGLLDSLQHDMEAFLDRRIFSIPAEETRSLQVQDRAASNVRVRLERNRDGWSFVSPIETAADTERVNGFIRYWQGLEAEEFLPGAEVPTGQDANSLRLTLQALSQRETLILVPAPEAAEEDLFFRARLESYPAVFKVSPESVQMLRGIQEDLRERRVLASAGTDWSSLEIRFGNLGLTLQELENGSWQILYTAADNQLNSLPADPESVSGLNNLFRELEAERFITDAPSEADLERFGLTDPQRRLVLRKSGTTALELQIGGVYPEEEQTLLYARTDQSDSVFLVRPYVLAALSLDPYSYRDRTIRELPETAEIANLQLIHRASGLQVPLTNPDDPDGSDPTALKALQAFVKSMRVEGFLNRPFSDPLVLGNGREMEWPYEVEARILYPVIVNNPEETVRFFLSERLGGTTQYIGDPQSGLVGILSASLIESLDPVFARFPGTPPVPDDLETAEPALPAP